VGPDGKIKVFVEKEAFCKKEFDYTQYILDEKK